MCRWPSGFWYKSLEHGRCRVYAQREYLLQSETLQRIRSSLMRLRPRPFAHARRFVCHSEWQTVQKEMPLQGLNWSCSPSLMRRCLASPPRPGIRSEEPSRTDMSGTCCPCRGLFPLHPASCDMITPFGTRSGGRRRACHLHVV